MGFFCSVRIPSGAIILQRHCLHQISLEVIFLPITFFKIILPQALKVFMPTYTGEVVGLIKATSVVGYIAVTDLTKVGDIIRSNTYEALFPLLAVAVIYFMITWLIGELLGYAGRRFDPKKRKHTDILKGVVR